MIECDFVELDSFWQKIASKINKIFSDDFEKPVHCKLKLLSGFKMPNVHRTSLIIYIIYFIWFEPLSVGLFFKGDIARLMMFSIIIRCSTISKTRILRFRRTSLRRPNLFSICSPIKPTGRLVSRYLCFEIETDFYASWDENSHSLINDAGNRKMPFDLPCSKI